MSRAYAARAAKVADLEKVAEERRRCARISPARSERPRGRRRTEVVLGDVHIPDEDPATWAIILAAIRDLKPSGVRVLGDLLDLESLNRHPPTGDDPPDLAEEYAAGNARLDELEAVAGLADVDIYEGNHEQRFFKSWATWPKAIRALIKPPHVALGVERRGWRWVPIPYMTHASIDGKAREVQPVKVGGLFLHHGDFYSKHHAAGHLDAYGVSQLYAHTHRAQQVVTTRPHPDTGALRVITVTGMPCVRRLRAPWRPQPKWTGWSNGFAVIEWDGDEASVYNVVVRDGAAAYGGFRWRA